MDNKIKKNICPLCQSHNNCQAHSDKYCWCNNIIVPQELIDLVPDASKGKSCICKACIEKFKFRHHKANTKRIL